MSITNSDDTIGNRNRGFSVCSAVPQPTAPIYQQRTQYIWIKYVQNSLLQDTGTVVNLKEKKRRYVMQDIDFNTLRTGEANMRF